MRRQAQSRSRRTLSFMGRAAGDHARSRSLAAHTMCVARRAFWASPAAQRRVPPRAARLVAASHGDFGVKAGAPPRSRPSQGLNWVGSRLVQRLVKRPLSLRLSDAAAAIALASASGTTAPRAAVGDRPDKQALDIVRRRQLNSRLEGEPRPNVRPDHLVRHQPQGLPDKHLTAAMHRHDVGRI